MAARAALSPRALAGLSLALIALLFLAVTFLANLWLGPLRADVTEDRLFTLSDGSRNLLAHLPAPVTVTFYFSRDLSAGYPGTRSYGQRVSDLLAEFQRASNGRLIVHQIDPQPFTDAEDEAVAAGMEPLKTPTGEDLYFGLSAQGDGDSRSIIAALDPARENFLEYDLARMIGRAAQPKRPVVGLLGNLHLEYGPGGVAAAMQSRAAPYVIFDEMRESFDLRDLNADLTKLDDVDVLMLLHPAGLDNRTLYAIDQYILRGGKAMLFVDPYSEMSAMTQSALPGQAPQDSSTLEPLFKSWGVGFDPNHVVVDRSFGQHVSMAGGHAQKLYIGWLSLRDSAFNADDVITAHLKSVNLATAGFFTRLPGASVGMEPLLVSSRDAAFMDVGNFRFQPDPDELLSAFRPSDQSYVLAARITGRPKSAFPDGPPKDGNGKTAPAIRPHLMQAAKPIQVVAVADTDLLDDRFWVQVQDYGRQRMAVPYAENANFVLNTLDNLAGSDALILLRSRGVSARPFTLFQTLQRQAEQKLAVQDQLLRGNLLATQKKLTALQTGPLPGDGARGGVVTSPEQQAEIARFRAELVSTRKKLRAVQLELRQNVENMQTILKAVNIAAVPAMLTVIALIVGLRRRRAAGRP